MATLALRNRPLGGPLQAPGAVAAVRDGTAQADTAALLQVDGVSLEYHTPGRVVRATHRVGFDVFAGVPFSRPEGFKTSPATFGFNLNMDL